MEGEEEGSQVAAVRGLWGWWGKGEGGGRAEGEEGAQREGRAQGGEEGMAHGEGKPEREEEGKPQGKGGRKRGWAGDGEQHTKRGRWEGL